MMWMKNDWRWNQDKRLNATTKNHRVQQNNYAVVTNTRWKQDFTPNTFRSIFGRLLCFEIVMCTIPFCSVVKFETTTTNNWKTKTHIKCTKRFSDKHIKTVGMNAERQSFNEIYSERRLESSIWEMRNQTNERTNVYY